MIMSSRNAIAPIMPVSMASIACWNIDGAVFTSKERRLYLNNSLWVLIVRSSLESSPTFNCKNVSEKPIFAKQIPPLTLTGTGREYWRASMHCLVLLNSQPRHILYHLLSR